MDYIIALACLVALYVASIALMGRCRGGAGVNIFFVLLVFIPYLLLCRTVYLSVGFDDWNFQNTLPVANVSPFMFALSPLALILPKRARRHFLLLISLLSVGMLISTFFSCIYNAVRNYKFHWHFMYDYVAHIVLSLFGVYLVKSGQVELRPRNCLKSSAIIIGSALSMMLLNLVFDTSFFGLSLNGKHNIYNNVIVDNSYLSALIYFVGLGFVLLAGYIYCRKYEKSRR